MATRARTISVNLTAGTAKFFTDLDATAGKLKEFGSHGVSSMQATSGAIRTLEGNFTNNIRAVERFIATTLGAGPILKAAFPIIGGVAFGGMLVEITGKAYKFWQEIATGPEKARGSFRELTASLQISNEQLQVSNDRLANDIARLEGRH